MSRTQRVRLSCLASTQRGRVLLDQFRVVAQIGRGLPQRRFHLAALGNVTARAQHARDVSFVIVQHRVPPSNEAFIA